MFPTQSQSNQKVKEDFHQYPKIELYTRRVTYLDLSPSHIWPRSGSAQVPSRISYKLLKMPIKDLNRKYTIKRMYGLTAHSNSILMGPTNQLAKDTYFSVNLVTTTWQRGGHSHGSNAGDILLIS